MPSVKSIKLSITILLLSFGSSITAQLVWDKKGFAFRQMQNGQCLHDIDRNIIEARLQHQIQQLQQHDLFSSATTRDAILLDWPLQANSNYKGFDYATISNYVDHDLAFPNQVKDYNCSNRTYDSGSGYNHAGTDFALWPMPWELMEKNAVEVVAAARGVIIDKQDGNFDKSCSLTNPEPWNAIYIMHADSSVAWYGHLKKNSLTERSIGATVERGEFLGVVGSSGASSAPHLHFELHDKHGNIIDPFAGNCNGSTEDTWWLEQRSYNDPSINLLTVSKTLPEDPECSEPELLEDSTAFCGSNQLYFIAYLRDQQRGQILKHSILRPDNTIFEKWESSIPETQADYFSASLMYQPFFLPEQAIAGTWTYSVDFLGKNYSYAFEVCDPNSIRTLPDIKVKKTFPNPASQDINLLLEINEPELYSFEVMDIVGRSLYKKETFYGKGESQFNLELDNFDKGVYFITIKNPRTNRPITVKRFIKY